MRGSFLLDLLFFSLSILALTGWGYFWYTCIQHSERLFKNYFGDATLAVVCIGFPFVFFGAFSLVLNVFGREVGLWLLAAFGAILPIIGIWSIKGQKWD